MTASIRPSLESAPVEGISARIDDLINERFRRLEKAVRQLQDNAIIEPRYTEPQKVFDGQLMLVGDGVTLSGIVGPRLAVYINNQWRAIAWLDEIP